MYVCRIARCSLLCLVVLVACKTAGPPGPSTPPALAPAAQPTWLADYARELDPGARDPLWPAIPAETRASIEDGLGAAAAQTGAARLAAAVHRLRGWELVAATPSGELGASLTTALEGLCLAEPLAFAEIATPEAYEAMGLLYHFYAAFDRPDVVAWVHAGPNVPGDREVLERVAEVAPNMRSYLAAQLLAHGGPPEVVADVLGDLGRRVLVLGMYPRARDLFRERIARRGGAATAEDWLDLAEAHGRLDERDLAGAAVTKARALAASRAGDRHLAARLSRGERQLASGLRLRTATGIERYDLLRGLGRLHDAGEVLDQLRRESPHDARVAIRVAIRAVDREITTDPFAAATAMEAELRDPAFTNQDATYWSTQVVLRATLAMRDISNIRDDEPARARKLADSIVALHAVTAQLAKFDPGRAVAMDFGFDHVFAHLLDGDITSGLDDRLADGLALRATYPDAPEIDQLVYMLATFDSDRARAFAAVVPPPRAKPADEPELYRKRARVAVTLAMVLATPDAVAAARRVVDDISPSEEFELEGVREALLGDCDTLDALAGAAGAWDRAAAHYRAARVAQHERARMYNNLAVIAQRGGAGGDAALQGFRDAIEALEVHNELSSAWIPSLNLILAGPPAARAADLPALASKASGMTEDHEPPVALQVWIAASAPARVDSAAAAQAALGRLGPADRKLALGRRGLEGPGSFNFSLGLASVAFYQFELGGYASLWLVPPWPLDRAGLEAKAGGPKPGGPKPGGPKPGAAPKAPKR